MNTSTIILKRPKLIVPSELLATTTMKNPTAFGFAGQKDGSLIFEISPKAIKVDELCKLMEVFKEDYLVMFFANFPKAVIPDDIQPWSVSTGGVDDEGKPIHDLALFFTGNFANYSGLNGDHTAEYCASDEAIFPRLSKAMVDSGGNVEKFYEELRKANVQKAMMNAYKDVGQFVMLPKTGEPICFGDTKEGGSYDWGITTNVHGWTPKVIEVPKAAAPKTGLAFLRGNTSSATHTTFEPEKREVVPVPEPEPSGGDGLPLKPGKENEQVGINPAIVGKTPQQLEAAGWKKMFPPPKLARGKARNLWLRIFNGGKLPPDHESAQCAVWVAPEIIDLAQRTASSRGDVEHTASQLSQRRRAQAKGDVIPMEEAHNELEAKANEEAELARHVLVNDGEKKPITGGRSTVREKHTPSGVPSANTSPYLPTMTDDEKLKAIYVLDEYFAKDKRPTPLEIQKGESKHATFSSAAGREFTDLLFLPVEQVYKLFDGNKIAVAAFIEMRRKYIEASKIDLNSLKQEQPTSNEEEPKVETKASVPEVPVKKSGGLAFLNRKVG